MAQTQRWAASGNMTRNVRIHARLETSTGFIRLVSAGTGIADPSYIKTTL